MTDLAELSAHLTKLHYSVDSSWNNDGSCIEDGQDWPCATMRAVYDATRPSARREITLADVAGGTDAHIDPDEPQPAVVRCAAIGCHYRERAEFAANLGWTLNPDGRWWCPEDITIAVHDEIASRMAGENA